jgi:hypothetical protein
VTFESLSLVLDIGYFDSLFDLKKVSLYESFLVFIRLAYFEEKIIRDGIKDWT